MDQFDFARLTDVDFEEVCQDLLARHLDLKLEIFKKGKDGGIDLRHMSDREGLLVVQCKHWINTGSAALLRHIRDKEMPKVRKLNPSRYVIAATCPLSAAEKSKLMTYCHPFIKDPADIVGGGDVAALLREHDDIVKRHLRLWLSSATVLDVVVNRDLYVRSKDLAEDISETLKRYVQTASYKAAERVLSKNGVCVISGEPGIGKTTLAQVLCAGYIADGYEVVDISYDSNDINKVWDDKRKQIYYYDDFLGRNFLGEMLNKNEDGRLLGLMRKVRQSSNKKFVLTTRSYFLEHARQKYERLDGSSFNPALFTVELSDFSHQARAEILYNHVYHSAIPVDEKVRFGELKLSLPIVRHANYNPRLIEDALAGFDLGSQTMSAPEYLIKSLDSPGEIWSHVVTNELSTAAVDVLEIVLGLGQRVSGEIITDAWVKFRANAGPKDERELQRALKVLDGSMIRVQFDPDDDEDYVSFSNPSIRDYMREYCAERPRVVHRLLGIPHRFEVIENLWLMASAEDQGQIFSYVEGALPEVLAYAKSALLTEPVSGRFLLNVCTRLRTLVLISIKFQTQDLDEFILSQIEELLRASWRPLASDINTLYFTLKMHPDSRFLEAGKRLVDGTVARLTENLEGDDFAMSKLARDELRELPSTRVSDEVLDEVESRLRRLMRSILEQWLLGDVDLDSYEVENMMDYANSFDRPEDFFKGYGELRDYHNKIESDGNEQEEMDWSIAGPDRSAQYKRAAEILTALQEYRDPAVDPDKGDEETAASAFRA